MILPFFSILLSLPTFSNEPLTRLPEGENEPVFMSTILFPGKVITDLQRNVLSVIIPLKKAGRLLLLEAIIDGRIGSFIFDTGSTGLVLNQTYFRDYAPMDAMEAGGITGSAGKSYRIRLNRLQLGNLVYEKLYADVMNLGHIENRRGIQVFGLFGLNLFKDMEMMVDLKNNELQLHKIDKDGKRLSGSTEKIIYDITGKVNEYENMAYVEVVIGEKVLAFCLDTGAESNVIDISLPKKVMETVTVLRRSTLQGVGSGTQDVLFGKMNDFMIGGEKLEDMQVIMTNLTGLSQKYGYPINGMLGYDFFEKGKIYINLVKHELGIVLNREVNP